jgi:very-short-patch-repair endonuclease
MTRRAPDDRPTAPALRGQPRLRAYVRESYGVHRRADLGDDLCAQLQAWQLLMTDAGCFTALTSAALRGWWLPPVPLGAPVFMALQIDDPRPMRAGVRTSRHTREVAREELAGLRCASAPETLLACARWIGLLDLVVLIDCALHQEDCDVDQIRSVIGPRRPGAAALSRALAFADKRSESPYETLLRLLHVLCGIEVESQYAVLDQAGFEVARADLRIVGTNALPEFDGDEHEAAPRRVKDRRRDRAIERTGHVRRGYTAGDVLHRGITILQDADRSIGRSHDPSRIRVWHDQLRRSLFMPSGQADFLDRVVPVLPVRRRAAGGPGDAA